MDSPEHLAETRYADPLSPARVTPPTPASAGATPGSAPASGGGSHGSQRTGGSRTGPPARFISGAMFGTRFRIIELLGRGGMGEVYRADDLQLESPVALKFLAVGVAGQAEWVERFRQEVRLARQIAHPNICRVYDLEESGADWCLSMEYVAGESLAQNLRRMGRPTSEKSLEIARQLCSGLAAIHDAGLVHRDLKPANIMLDDRGRVRITDFGLAGIVQDLKGEEVRAGTPAYMSPEQLSGREVTQRSDIYALGLILYELFTGKRTFEADSFLQWRTAHEQTEPITPTTHVPDLDPRVVRVILRCLEKEATRRPPSALAVLAALPGGDPLAAALAAGETPTAEMVAASGETSGLSPGRAMMGAAIFLGCLALIGWLNNRTTLFRLVDLPKSREVLLDRAGEIVRRFAPALYVHDYAGGFTPNMTAIDRIANADSSPQRWDKLRTDGRAVEFWYRCAPWTLVPNNVSGGRVSLTDPPAAPGMAAVRLDPAGRLIEFEQDAPSSPAAIESPASSTQPRIMEWVAIFEAAGLNLADFDEAQPTLTPPVGCDQRLAWVQREPPDIGPRLAVDGATLGSRIVYFDAHPAEPTIAKPFMRTAAAAPYENVVWVIIHTLSIAAAALLARHNLLKNRCYTCGARRVSLAALLVGVAWWLLVTRHVLDPVAEFDMFRAGIGRVLFIAGWIWLLYLGLEPFVRRVWPDTLISWTRLLEGRFRDPLVGRDALIGAAAGLGGVLMMQLRLLLPMLIGAPPPRPLWPALVTGLGESRFLMSWLVDPMLFLMPMFCLFLLVLTRLVIGNRMAVRIVVTALLVVMVGAQEISDGSLLACVLSAALMAVNVWVGLWICTRFGLLALTVMIFAYQCARSCPLTFDGSAWYAPAGFFCAAAMTILVGAAFYVALGGRRILREGLLEARAG